MGVGAGVLKSSEKGVPLAGSGVKWSGFTGTKGRGGERDLTDSQGAGARQCRCSSRLLVCSRTLFRRTSRSFHSVEVSMVDRSGPFPTVVRPIASSFVRVASFAFVFAVRMKGHCM